MEKIKSAVFDTGPIIHLEEIDGLFLLALFKEIGITSMVVEELNNSKKILNKYKNIKVEKLDSKHRSFSEYLIAKFNLDLGEATSIALCKQEKIKLFFTDDLEARDTADFLGFEAHGTLAIVLRAFREQLLSKKQATEIMHTLSNKSSLFLTNDLLRYAINEIEKS